MLTLLQQLLNFESFSTVPHHQLNWLIKHSKIRKFEGGAFVGIQGKKIDGPHFLIKGNILMFMYRGNEKQDLLTLETGDIFGYLPYSRSDIAPLNALALDQVEVLSFETSMVREMISLHFELTQSLVHIMNTRVRSYTTLQQQNDKMASLGKLAAGLAHELNNPASALISDATALKKHLRTDLSSNSVFATECLENIQREDINNRLIEIISGHQEKELSYKEQNQKENSIIKWMEHNSISYTEEMIEVFADFNIQNDSLEFFKRNFPIKALAALFKHLTSTLVTEKIARNIQVASSRIADLVRSVKIYTHMDRGQERAYSNIHEGIDNTIRMLGHKIRAGKIHIDKRYAEGVPPVNAHTGELNQVWTNLIDNAIDSMLENKEGLLTIMTELAGNNIKISFTDDGPGIPENIINNIFDPFFTTKPIGSGTGMGLENVRRIILRHGGSVKVYSVPRNTVFTVCIPINT
ncbi:ATP-binding protein [Pedobacter paludis]|uniref:histidine kinase n=1 Tax=Pedobacter paludis TaxID=2203212 RepID=A0A317EVE5_9SPHI|nr:ATP-binding protein [Pedobacter paludis]PWS30412.1 cyclic nucleotide-binding protein [Pedobacter paludis]